MIASYSLSSLLRNCASRVALPSSNTSTPVANGSSVPVWPMRRSIAGVGRVAEPDDRVILLVLAAEKLRQPRCFAEQQYKHAGRKWIERAGMANASFVKNMTHTRHYVVRRQICRLVDN